MKTGNLTAVSLALGSGVLTATALALASGYGGSHSRSAAASDPLYQEECGSCHVAYPAELLPPSDWQRIMDSLEHHFGDNAELDRETEVQIRQFLAANGEDDEDEDRVVGKSANDTRADAALPRIIETPHFVSEHDEIPGRLVSAPP